MHQYYGSLMNVFSSHKISHTIRPYMQQVMSCSAYCHFLLTDIIINNIFWTGSAMLCLMMLTWIFKILEI